MNGKVIMEDRVLRTIDEAEMLDRIERSAHNYIQRAGKDQLIPDYAR